MLKVCGLDSSTVCNTGSIYGDGQQCEIVFPPVVCPEQSA